VITVIIVDLVKKTKADVAAQKASHTTREKLRRELCEEQERNVQRKKVSLVGKTKTMTTDAVDADAGATRRNERMTKDGKRTVAMRFGLAA